MYSMRIYKKEAFSPTQFDSFANAILTVLIKGALIQGKGKGQGKGKQGRTLGTIDAPSMRLTEGVITVGRRQSFIEMRRRI